MIIEHHVFRLADPAAETAFLEVDRRMQTEVAVFGRGFIRRTTARGDDGRWLVETLWFDRDAADRVRAQEAGSDAAAVVEAFRSLIDPSSERLDRFETLE